VSVELSSAPVECSPPPEREGGPIAAFRALRDRGVAALRAGDLAAALSCFEQATEVARSSGDADLVDLAECNRTAIAIELGSEDGLIGAMRAVLLRSSDRQNCMVAATNAARIYDLAKEYKKGLFYARLARDHSEASGDASQQASIRNLLANLLLAESHVEEAAREYEAALELMPEDDPVWRARAIGNLGYCRILEHRLRDAFALLRQSIGELRRREARLYLISPLTDLAFAHLEAGHPADACEAAREALELARELGDSSGTKNALYLLGEAAGLTGDIPLARRSFLELQERFYPDKPFVCDFLLSVDVRKVVNLRA
jgi:tetratricopeptide (TPR) repeat protein